MHLIPKFNYELSLSDYEDNLFYNPGTTEDILTVSLNNRFGIHVNFIPQIKGIENQWPFDYEYDLDSVEGTRKEILLESKYVVMDSEKYKQTEKILYKKDLAEMYKVSEDKINHEIVVFFVSKKEFDFYYKELNEMFYFEGSIINLFTEDLEKKYELPKFIKNRIVNSPYLSDSDLNILKRERDTNGNVVAIKIE
jgi:hypothetical protein